MNFPDPKAMGWLFQGRTQGWGAVEGYTQSIPKSFITGCGSCVDRWGHL